MTRSATCWWPRATARARWRRIARASTIFEALAERDAANTEWQRDLSVSHGKIGDVLVAQGDGAGRAGGLSQEPRYRRGAGGARSGQHRVATRPLGQPRQDRRRAGGAGRRRRGAGGLSQRPRYPRGAGGARSGQHRVAARPLGQPRQDRRRAGGPGRRRRGRWRPIARAWPSPRRWRRAIRPIPSGSATSRSATTRSATCWWPRATAPGALAAYRKGLAIREALAARDPANTEWQRDLSVSHDKIGDVLVAQGDGPGALAAYRKRPRHPPRRWRRAIRPTPSGSATSRSATTRSATCWWPRATAPGRWPPIATASPSPRRWRRAIRPTPSGSATSRSATTRSATCWWPRATGRGRWPPIARASPSRGAGRARSGQYRMATRPLGQP